VQKSLMPKGVDHLGVDTDSDIAAGVQKSLMPKGVDHGRFVRSGFTESCAKIFDAERR